MLNTPTTRWLNDVCGGCLKPILVVLLAIGFGGMPWAMARMSQAQDGGVISTGIAPDAAPATESPHGLTGETSFHFTANEFREREARYSSSLQEYRREYRLTWLIRNDEERAGRMLEIAHEVEILLPRQLPGESLVWLKLLQDAYAAGDDLDGAFSAIDRRYEELAARNEADVVTEELLDEAALAATRGKYELAARLYDKAESLAESDEMFSRVMLTRGRMILEGFGLDAAVEYYLWIMDAYLDELPALARRAHLAAARAYHLHGELDAAMLELEQIQVRYPGAEEADEAGYLIEGWKIQPWELETLLEREIPTP